MKLFDTLGTRLPRGPRLGLAAACVSLLVLSGCATMGPSGVRAGGVTLVEITAMLDAKRPQAEIAAEIKRRGLAAQASASDVEALEKRGAQADVIDAVLIASWDDSAERMAAAPAWPYYSGPYYYGSPWPYYGPWGGYGMGFSYGWGGGGYYGGNRFYRGGGFPGGGFRGGAAPRPPMGPPPGLRRR